MFVWPAFGRQWEDGDKISFDGDNKLIVVHSDVTTLDIRSDVWSGWIRWQERYQDEMFVLAMRRTGLETTPAGPTGAAYFLTNNWKLLVDFSKVRISGVLFSDNYDSAYFTPDGVVQYAAEIATIVNTVEIPTAVTATIDQPSADLIRDTILASVMEGTETLAESLRIMRAESAGKVSVAGGIVSFRDAADTKARIVSTVDNNGQRTTVTTDGS